MSTLAEVLKEKAIILKKIEFFGAEKEFSVEFRNRFGALGSTICSEYGLTPEEAAKLSPETELGPEAEADFAELKQWLEAQEQSEQSLITSAK